MNKVYTVDRVYADSLKSTYILAIYHTYLLLKIQSDRLVTMKCLLLCSTLHLKLKGGREGEPK